MSITPLISDFAALNVHAEPLFDSPLPADVDATPRPDCPHHDHPNAPLRGAPIVHPTHPFDAMPPSTTRSLTANEDFFVRRHLRALCTQPNPLEDFLPQASEILPGLYLSDLYTATNPAVLEALGITHLVSVLRDAPPAPPGMRRLRVPVDDMRGENLLAHLEPAVLWIERALRGGGIVLVHCVWGMSRSAALVMAYLMAVQRMSLAGAWAHVRIRRRVARPNRGFVRQLAVYEHTLEAGRRLHEANMARMKELVRERKERIAKYGPDGGIKLSAGAKVLSLS